MAENQTRIIREYNHDIAARADELAHKLTGGLDGPAIGEPIVIVGWILYLLEAMDNRLEEEEMQAVLQGLRDDIKIRLDTGGW